MKQLRDFTAVKLQRIVKIKRQIERLEANLDTLIGNVLPGHLGDMHRARRRMSASARKRISMAAKARWARFRAAKAK